MKPNDAPNNLVHVTFRTGPQNRETCTATLREDRRVELEIVRPPSGRSRKPAVERWSARWEDNQFFDVKRRGRGKRGEEEPEHILTALLPVFGFPECPDEDEVAPRRRHR